MICPSCETPNDEAEEVCFNCRTVLSAVTAGTVIGGRYEVLSRLGRGGMGTVYRAHDRDMDETVALKILRSDLGHSADVAKRFRSETKLARRIGHRNVCRVFESGQDGPIRFIAMELVEGTDLKQLLAKGPLPWAQAFDLSTQIAQGLSAIHELGIVHRDLKTTNIMLDSRGTVRLMDFGIAKRFTTEAGSPPTATADVIGTPEYMSPEQARAERVDARSDIYALGVVIFEIFTGSVPFKSDTPVATLLMHIHQPPPLVGGPAERLPGSLRPVLGRALAKKAEERFASATEMVVALHLAAMAAGIEASPASAGAMPALQTPTPMSTPAPAVVTDVPGSLPERATREPPARRPPAQDVATTAVPPLGATGPRPSSSRSGARVAALAGAGVAITLATLATLWPRFTSQEILAPATSPLSSPATAPFAPSAPPNLVMSPPIEFRASTAYPTPSPRPTAASRMSRSVEGDADRLSSRALPVDGGATTMPAIAPIASPSSMLPTTAHEAGDAHESTDVEERAPALTVSPDAPPTNVPTPASAPALHTGLLHLVVVPFAEVTINDKPPVRVTSTKLPLAPGPHLVVLVHPEYQPLRRRVSVAPGETLKLVIDMAEEGVRKKR